MSFRVIFRQSVYNLPSEICNKMALRPVSIHHDFGVEGYVLGWPKRSLVFSVQCYRLAPVNFLANPIDYICRIEDTLRVRK